MSITPPLYFQEFGTGTTVFLWAHGWGQSGEALRGIAEGLKPLGRHILIDFPGFGQSPMPETPWTVRDYAAYLHKFLKTQKADRIIWVGHSFGCRVGIKLESLMPGFLNKMILIAAPGLKRKRTLWESIKFQTRMRSFKVLKLYSKEKSLLKKSSISTTSKYLLKS
jgi:pimeloyl-ACP methyl ester carboxylesterase